MKYLSKFIIAPLLVFISFLPFRVLYFFSDIFFYIIYYIVRYRRKIVRKNLLLSNVSKDHNDLIRIEKNFYKHLTDVFFEMFKFYGISTNEMKKRFYIENPEIFFELEKKNKSVIFMTSHYGGYEWLLSINYHVPQLPFAIYTPLTNKSLDELIKKFRLKHGSKLISRYEAALYIKNQIKDNKLFLYGMAADQSAQIRSTTYWKKFLGIKVPVFTGSERIAKKYNIPVVFGKVIKIKRGYYKVIVELISEFPNNYKNYHITDVYLEKLEEQIKQKPEYYYWTHNRFKHMYKAPKD